MGLEIFYKLFCAVIFKSLSNTRLVSLRKQLKESEERHCKHPYREKRSVTAVYHESLLS